MERFARLSDLTADEKVSSALRFLAHAALPGNGGPVATAADFCDRYPRDDASVYLRKALSDGDLIQKAIIPATTENVAYAGALMPPAWLKALENRLQQLSVLARIPGLIHDAPINVPIPTEAAAPSLQWVAENALKPNSNLTFADMRLALYKFAGILVLSEDLARVTRDGATAIMERLLVDASVRFLDTQFLDPAVAFVANKTPASITNGRTPVAAGATLDATLAALVAAFYAQRPNALLPTFLLSPLIAANVSASGNHPGLLMTGGTLLGAPAVITVGAGKNVILADASGIVAHDGGAKTEVSDKASPIDGGVPLDLWQHNLVGIKLDRFCSWQAEPTAVAYTVTT